VVMVLNTLLRTCSAPVVRTALLLLAHEVTIRERNYLRIPVGYYVSDRPCIYFRTPCSLFCEMPVYTNAHTNDDRKFLPYMSFPDTHIIHLAYARVTNFLFSVS